MSFNLEIESQAMKLTDSQRIIFNAVVLKADAPIGEIAKSIGLREHIVRRGLAFFQDRGIFLRRSIWIDPHQLGFTLFVVHLELPLSASRHRADFIKSLVALDESCSVAELGGEGMLEVRILAYKGTQLWTILEKLAAQISFPFKLRSYFAVVESEYSGTFEGTSVQGTRHALSFSATAPRAPTCQVDDKDHMILSTLANQAYMNLQSAARLLGIPSTTLLYRIEKLEKAGIIRGHYYITDPKVFGETPICLQMRTSVLTAKQTTSLKAFCRAHPQISAVSFLLGEISVEMYALVREQKQLQEIIYRLSEKFEDCVESIKITPQTSFAKYTLYPFQKSPFTIADRL